MQFSETRASGHLDAIRRGGALAACIGVALFFVWSWTVNSQTRLSGIQSAVSRAAEIANAPASVARPWLPVSLAVHPIGE